MAGNKNSGRKPNERLFREVLTAKLKEVHDSVDGTPRQKVEAVADVLIGEALKGDTTAIGMVMDRVDGKATQYTDVSGTINHQHEQVANDADTFTSRFAAQLAAKEAGKGTAKPH